MAVDNAWPYNVYGGLQDNGTWMGPSHTSDGIAARHWRNLEGGDGFWAFVDPGDEDIVYTEYQGGRLSRFRKSNGESKNIAPMQRLGEPKLRFNWNTPIHVGAKSGRLYFGAQFLFRSSDRGETWDRISGDLTTNDPAKQRQEASGGVSVDNSSAENHCTIFTICASPMNGEVVWVGTDDGNLQVTRDGGTTWKNAVDRIPGVPKGTYVSRVVASHHAEGTAYATFDGHRGDDFSIYVFMTADYGETWKDIGGSLPKNNGILNVIREHMRNPDLLFVGTEYGAYASWDRGMNWSKCLEGE